MLDIACAPIELEVGRIFTGCTIGVAFIEDPNLSSSECLRRAGMALYAAKEEGRGRFNFYKPKMDEFLRDRRFIRDDLREALEQNQLSVVYQPQVHTCVVYGVECLVRWNHPVRGAIPPSLFVGIAEESGLIERLGEFTLRRAFQDSRRLNGLTIAINLSAAQLRLRGFTDHLKEIISQAGVDPKGFEFEITESLLLGDAPHIRDTLNEIRSLGFRVALDDFGAGYSSLSYLQRYPIDEIKIDRPFINNLGVEENADAVVGAIVRLARALRLDVIAEWVETELQRMRLAAAGCGDIQGFLFGKPSGPQAAARSADGFIWSSRNQASIRPSMVRTP